MLELAAIPKYVTPDLFKVPAVSVQEVSNEGIQVQFRFQEIQNEGKTVRFWGGVTATYGQTVLKCEELFLDYANKSGKAVGKVRLIDPDGTLEGENLEFNWEKRTGVASNVNANVAGMKLRMSKIEIAPNNWILYDVNGTPSKTHPPEFELGAKRLTLTPGKSGRAIKPTFKLFGTSLGTVPYYNFSLDTRVIGFRLPAINYKRGLGLGVGWNSAFMLGSQTSITGKIATLPKALPSSSIEIASSPIAAENQIGRLTTRPDSGDRLFDSWIDSILVPNKEREARSFRAPRKTFSAGSYWNLSTRGRESDVEELSKPFDIAFEMSGPIGDGGLLGQLRLQRIRGQVTDSYVDRALVQLIAHSSNFDFGNGLGAYIRLDGNSAIEKDNQYSWLRASAVATSNIGNLGTFGIGYSRTFETGTPTFGFDQLYSRNSVNLRSDFDFGSIFASGLIKYDLDRKAWYDVEYSVAFVAGSFEPFFTYRQVPREVQFGIRLRMNDFFDRLSKRKVERKSPPSPKTGSDSAKP